MRKVTLGLFLVLLLGLSALGSTQGGTITIRLAHQDNPFNTSIIAQLISMFVDPLNLTGPNGEPVQVVGEPTADITNAVIADLAAGTAADIFYLDIFEVPRYVATGQVLPLNDLIQRTGFDIENFIPSLVDAFTVDGNILAIVKDFNALALYYNIDAFARAGVDVPDADDTWDDFAAKVKAVTQGLSDDDPSNDIHGFPVQLDFARWGPFAYATGQFSLFNPDGTSAIASEGGVRALQFWQDLASSEAGIFVSECGGWTGGCFINRRSAIALEGAWLLGALASDAPDLNYGTTLLPLDPVTGQRSNLLFTVGYAINAQSPYPELAFQVIQAISSLPALEFQLNTGLAIPARTALLNSPYFSQDTPAARANRTVFEGAQGAHPFSFPGLGGTYKNEIDQALTEALQQGADPATALSQAAERVNEALRDAGLLQ
ncbi:MAG: extracellular solute-binding protein [Deinococcus sp.]|nr:extracellular solute-binding protein [Deinococcus sp.]